MHNLDLRYVNNFSHHYAVRPPSRLYCRHLPGQEAHLICARLFDWVGSLLDFRKARIGRKETTSHEPDQNCVRSFLLAVCGFCLRAGIARRATTARTKIQAGRGKTLERRGQTLETREAGNSQARARRGKPASAGTSWPPRG